MECAKVTASVKKAKKKQVKDELERIKQAEKKKRRLEKALATSAAICSELEKKKLKKKEEQERLDEEGAAIAEAVALQVLLGEDSDDLSKVMLNKYEGLTSWDHHASNVNMIVGLGGRPLVHHHDLSMYSCENIDQGFDAHQYGRNLEGHSDMMTSTDRMCSGFYPQNYTEECWGGVGISAEHLAVQAISSLKIADDAIVFNRSILRG